MLGGSVVTANTTVITATATYFRLEGLSGFRRDFYGQFTYDINGNLGGTINTIDLFNAGTSVFSISGMALDVAVHDTYVSLGWIDGLFAYAIFFGDDTITGSAGDDLLIGFYGNDILSGGLGNDLLIGEQGNDTYCFNGGQDTIIEVFDTSGAQNYDVLEMDASILPNTVVAERHLYDLVLSVTGSSDSITIENYYYEIAGAPGSRVEGVEEIRFADGTVWTYAQLDLLSNIMNGTASGEILQGIKWTSGVGLNDALNGLGGDDTLYGYDGNDVLVGGTGNDYLDGGRGNDTYAFNAGDGQDIVFDNVLTAGGLETLNSSISNADVLSLNGILPNAVTVNRHINDLVITLSGGTDSVTINSYFLTGAVGGFSDPRPYFIETILFADNSIWDANYVDGLNLASTINGTAGADLLLQGGETPDLIYGFGGNDWLEGLDGDDTLSGGSGNDSLLGGGGSNVYQFGRGDGSDLIISDTWRVDGVNAISFAPDVMPSDVVVARPKGANDLVFKINGTPDTITVGGYFSVSRNNDLSTYTWTYDFGHTVDEAWFADGTKWDLSQYRSLKYELDGASSSDFLQGSELDDVLNGFDGNDYIWGGDGSDILDGGVGADYLAGGWGDDTYIVDNIGDVLVEDPNDGWPFLSFPPANPGTDIVISSVAFTLGDKFENLTLSGTAAVDGTGNTLDNVLAGNSNNNILTGAGGNDTFAFAASGNGLDTITDFAAGGSISVAGASFSGVVAAGNGSTLLANQAQFASAGGTTTLFIGTDVVLGADIQIQLTGTYSADNFFFSGDRVLFNSLPTGSVSIAGAAFRGYTLTASNTLADADGLGVIGYQWLADGVDIAGATNSTYIPIQADVGKSVSVAAGYVDGHGAVESVASNGVTISIPPSSKYFVTQSAGDNLTHFDWAFASTSLQGQYLVFTGTNGIDNVAVAPGIKFDFTKSNGGIDNIYLAGNLADYATAFTTSTLTLTRGSWAGTETILLTKGSSTNYDTVVFADGAASTFDLHGWASGGAMPALGASPAQPTTLNATIKGFALDATGEVFTGTAPGINFIATGGNGADIVYVKAGATVDASKLNSGEDKIYFTGNWADYSKAATTSKITFTNATTGDSVIVAAATGASNDRLVFADGYVLSNEARVALLGDAAAPLAAVSGFSTAEVTPSGMGDILLSLIDGFQPVEIVAPPVIPSQFMTSDTVGAINTGTPTATELNIYGVAPISYDSTSGGTGSSSTTILITSIAQGPDTVVGFSSAPVANGGDVLDLSAIANLTDAVATGQTLTTDFVAANVFIFDATPVTIADAANAIAADVSVIATDGYIVIADSASGNAVTVYYSTDLAANGAETALAILSGVNIAQLTAGNILV